jgi:hypothetical protein
LKDSRHSLNSSYNAGGSLPNTPGRSRASNSMSQNDPRKSKSNDNLKRAGTNKNATQYQSAPHLNNSQNDSMNNSRMRSQNMEVEDLTDDSEDDN